MLGKLPQFALAGLLVLGLASCNDDGDSSDTDTSSSTSTTDTAVSSSTTPVSYVNADIYTALRAASPDTDAFFSTVDTLVGAEKCDVQVLRMTYDTVGGKGEATTSSGVIMLPRGTSTNCSGARPTVLYAHGTARDSRYDLSQFMVDASNPASGEAVLLLALYAARGYIVIAPNYAGYADSTLGYHPFMDEAQQSSEMMTALDTARTDSATIGAEMSTDLFISGMSQGGYVAMATHKALQAKGEVVRASAPISGAYTLLDSVDTLMAGYVNAGANIFTPLLVTALEQAHDIYDNPDEIYSADFAATAENVLPRVGGISAAVAEGLLPAAAIFSGTAPALEPPLLPFQQAGFGTPHLISDELRTLYLTDVQVNGDNPTNKIRILLKDGDMNDWTPTTPTLMCGASSDPVVYFSNTQKMSEFWTGVPTVLTLDLETTPTTLPLVAFAALTQQWQAGVSDGSIAGEGLHTQTSVYCGLAAYGFFQTQRTQ